MNKATQLKYKNVINKVWIKKNQIFIKKTPNSTPKKITDVSEINRMDQQKNGSEDEEDDDIYNSAEDTE